jgi:hypothetical protein
MPQSLALQSEPFSATGGAAAEGVSNQLGRPRADRFTLLVREAVQNSWDARLDQAGGVRFQIDGYLLARERRQEIAARVFGEVPMAVGIRERLFSDVDFPVLAIGDFGTRGLGGPTRGDVIPRPGESTNFVDFMRFIGRPPNREYAGGTYGFGKAAYFLASSLRTVCVYTRFGNGTGAESRFMAAALGPQFATEGETGRRYTGRHWWGHRAEDQVVDPVTGSEADVLGTILGGPSREAGAFGTTVYVLAPDFEGVAPEAMLANMGRAIMDYFWPKSIDGKDQQPTMTFGVRWQDHALPLPTTKDDPQLALLARAFEATSSKQATAGSTLESIASLRPKKLLGHLALARQLGAATLAAEPVMPSEAADSNLYQGALRRPMRQIALMRAPNFVVKYLEGPAVPYELAEYAGVFKVDAAVDAAFARAEPPTHDDWVPDLVLDASEKTYVRVALRRAREVIDAFAAPQPIEIGGSGTQSVAGFSRFLGGLVPGLSSDAKESSRAKPRKNGGARQGGAPGGRNAPPHMELLGEPTVEMVDGARAMVARFRIEGRGRFTVAAQPKVVIADGFESEPPEGADQPRVIKWIAPHGASVPASGLECRSVPGGDVWAVVVSVPADAKIAVTLRAEPGGAE